MLNLKPVDIGTTSTSNNYEWAILLTTLSIAILVVLHIYQQDQKRSKIAANMTSKIILGLTKIIGLITLVLGIALIFIDERVSSLYILATNLSASILWVLMIILILITIYTFLKKLIDRPTIPDIKLIVVLVGVLLFFLGFIFLPFCPDEHNCSQFNQIFKIATSLFSFSDKIDQYIYLFIFVFGIYQLIKWIKNRKNK